MRSKNILNIIRLKNANHMILPGILLILIIVLYFNSPLHNVLYPSYINKLSDIESVYNQDSHYINLIVDNLYDSGIDCYRNGKLSGRYYYAFENSTCYFFLISAKHLDSYSKENDADLSILNDVIIKACVVKNTAVLRDIVNITSRDLAWTYDGMNSRTSGYLISEPDYPYIRACIIITVFSILALISIHSLLYSLFCICFPYLYKSVIKLKSYGKVKKHISQANAELKNSVALCSGPLTITENYLMVSSTNDFQIIPLDHIVWAYKFSSYHPLRYMNRKITYTLCVYGKHNVSLISPHNLKTNADSVLEYLHNLNQDILIGYSREQEALAKIRM